MPSTRLAFAVVALLAVADAAMRLSFAGRHTPQDSLWWLFDATREASIPTLFSIVAMGSLGLCCFARTRQARGWWLPGLGFAYLSIDDACGLHERLGEVAAPWLAGFGTYSWIVLLAPLFAIGGLLVSAWCWRALDGEPRRRRRLLAGFAALGLALLIEALEERSLASTVRLRGIALVEYTKWLEELLEMLGPVLLLEALHVPAPVIVIANATAAPASAPLRRARSASGDRRRCQPTAGGPHAAP